MTNATLELMRTRRSVKAALLAEPAPSADELRLMLEAAIRVPDHGKLAPWRLQVLDKTAQKSLGTFLGQVFKETMPEANEKQVAFEENRPQRSPLLVIVTSTPVNNGKIPILEQTLSAGAVCQNLLNAAHALGYAANWLTEWPAYNSRVKEHLGFGEEDQIVGFIHIGTPTETPEERVRATYEQTVSAWRGA